MNISTKMPKFIETVYRKFEENGYELYLVGGSVRNLLLFKNIKDWDMTTNATPQQMLSIFPDAFYDNQFGTVGIPIEDQIIEVTTFRSESEYKDKRHPENVTWGRSIEEDLERRDFTINAIALKLSITNENFSL